MLAGLNLVSLSALLLLNHASLTAFREGVNTNQVWSVRQSNIIELQRRAQAVDAPPNDIFVTRSVESERQRLATASARFDEQMLIVHEDFANHRLSVHDDDILEQLAAASELMSGLKSASRRTITDFAGRGEVSASREMAVADSIFYDLLGRLEAASSIVERARSENLVTQLKTAGRMLLLEIVFGLGVVVTIAPVVGGGLQVVAWVRNNDARQQRTLAELSDTRDRLRQYADNVSHELRVPISRMRLDAELLLSQPRSLEQYRSGIEEILTQCNEVSSIAEALLFIARAENTSVALKRQHLDVRRELEVIVDYFTASAEQAGIELTLTEASGRLWADRALVQRALSNLIRNALVHTPRGTRVTVSAVQRDIDAVIEVRDTGPGLPEAILADPFRRFQRGSGAGDGSGLGLAIVKTVMDLHGGRIEISAEGGLSVHLVFPGTPPESVAAAMQDVARVASD